MGQPTIEVKKYIRHNYGGWEQDAPEGTTVNVVPDVSTNGTISMSLDRLSVLENQKHTNETGHTDYEFYIVTYTYPIIDQTVTNVSPKNTVTVSAEDEDEGQTVSDSAESTVNLYKDLGYTLTKSGTPNDRPGYIKWTITVNSNEVDIAGATLTDEMLNQVETDGDIVVSPYEGVSVNWENGVIKDISFAPIKNGTNKNKYEIIYYTPVTESWDGTTVSNKATFTPPGDESEPKEVTATIHVNGVQMNKGGVFNGASEKIEWTITESWTLLEPPLLMPCLAP